MAVENMSFNESIYERNKEEGGLGVVFGNYKRVWGKGAEIFTILHTPKHFYK